MSSPLLASLLLVGAPAAAPAGPPGSPSVVADPFTPGLRWSWGASPTDPWIPRDVTFAARGELVWAAPGVGSPRLSLLAGAGGAAGPLLEDATPATGLGTPRVAAGDDPDELFAAAQYGSDPAARRTELTRHDAPGAVQGGLGLTPTWTHDPGGTTDRPARIATDDAGELVVLATFRGGAVDVDWIDAASGLRLVRHSVPGSALQALALSADGERAAIVAGADVTVVDRDGTRRLEEVASVQTTALGLSADGSRLAFGRFGGVELRGLDASGVFVPLADVPAAGSELPTRVALDGHGERLAVGWWDFTTGLSVRLEVVDTATGVSLVERLQPGQAGAPQNFPAAVRITRDGRRAAFGLWGASDPRPEALLVDVDGDVDVLAVDLVGSVEALALDRAGTRLALATKDAHANVLSSTGAVKLVDSGERDLQVVAAPTPGGELALAARREAQLFTFFVLGAPGSATSVADVGISFLDATAPVVLFGAVPDASGAASRALAVPDDPALVGLELAVQAAFAMPTTRGVALELSASHVRPAIL